MYIDAHAHIYSDKFIDDIDQVIERAKNNKVNKIFMPNIDLESINRMNLLADKYESICYPMMGLHPCSVDESYKDVLDRMYSMMSEGRKYYGIGETGIDLYWDVKFKKQQVHAFEMQIEWAKEYHLPIIIHSRESLDLTIDIISNYQDGTLNGIFHCFNGSIDQCRKIADLNFYMGLGGVITYKNAGLNDMVAYMPSEYMLLETDAPYLSPVPHRGKRNECGYIPHVVDKITEVRNETTMQVGGYTTSNAKKIFKFED
jgi:TatD DNase family protein